MNNVKFPKYMFVLLFLHTTENNFVERKEHEMKKWRIPNVYTSLIFKKKKSVLAMNGITVHFLHFALVSVETNIL